ncbi:MFS transporter, partial [Enterobacter cloacae complex sp.6701988]|uniref:MFS transporter n=1 Tax=Enterobacter cloacae complex sp.6701988 TaxID=3397175 RepID=UPI003AAF917C
WSPMMDRYTPPFLGRRRGWLSTTQILLVISIAGMSFMNPSEHLWWLAALAVTVAFCSASQDIVFDAYKTDLLSAEERGIGAATSVMGYRISMLVSGGLALWLADKFLTWQQLYLCMAG